MGTMKRQKKNSKAKLQASHNTSWLSTSHAHASRNCGYLYKNYKHTTIYRYGNYFIGNKVKLAGVKRERECPE